MIFKLPNTSEIKQLPRSFHQNCKKKFLAETAFDFDRLIQISKLDKSAMHQNKQINDKNQENDLNEGYTYYE